MGGLLGGGWWLEVVVSMMLMVRRKSPVPLSAGEVQAGLMQFDDVEKSKCMTVVVPDVDRRGYDPMREVPYCSNLMGASVKATSSIVSIVELTYFPFPLVGV
ncbi:hypothetical protein Tco_1176274 [Tanacetum coccineum]